MDQAKAVYRTEDRRRLYHQLAEAVRQEAVDVPLFYPAALEAMTAIGVIYAPRFARLVRGQALSVREELYVESARALGASHGRILGRHLLPNVLSPVVVQVSVSVAFALLAETGLSFLGVGIRPPAPSWGADVGRGYRFMRLAPWLIFMPGMAIMLSALAFTFIGDGLRDALDPRHRGRGGARDE